MNRKARRRLEQWLELECQYPCEDNIDLLKSVNSMLNESEKISKGFFEKVLAFSLTLITNLLIVIICLTFERWAPITTKMFSWVKPLAYSY